MPCLYSYLWRRMTELLACSLTVIVVMFFMSTLVTERVTATRDNPWLSGSYYPQWSQVSATEVIDFIYNAGLTSEQNGALLASTMNGLTPGQELRIGPGTYSINMWYSLEIQGTEINPIRITAMDFNDKPIFTRPNANQNVINIGVNSTTEYVAFIGIEITGGDTLMKIYNASNFWVDQCTIHDGDGVGIAANSQDTSYLYITRNHIYHPGTSDNTGEGMYLGANNSASVMTHSVIALNHVHDTGGTQGMASK